MRAFVCICAIAMFSAPQQVLASTLEAPRTSINTYTDASCLLPTGTAAKPDRFSGAEEVARAGGCVTVKDAAGGLFYVMEADMARGDARRTPCDRKASGNPRAPNSAAQSAGAGSQC